MIVLSVYKCSLRPWEKYTFMLIEISDILSISFYVFVFQQGSMPPGSVSDEGSGSAFVIGGKLNLKGPMKCKCMLICVDL